MLGIRPGGRGLKAVKRRGEAANGHRPVVSVAGAWS